jgi:hypothetical protein
VPGANGASPAPTAEMHPSRRPMIAFQRCSHCAAEHTAIGAEGYCLIDNTHSHCASTLRV